MAFSIRRKSPWTALSENCAKSRLELAAQDLALFASYRQPWLRFFGHVDHVFLASLDKRELLSKPSVEIRARDWFAPDDLPELTASTQEALRRLNKQVQPDR